MAALVCPGCGGSKTRQAHRCRDCRQAERVRLARTRVCQRSGCGRWVRVSGRRFCSLDCYQLDIGMRQRIDRAAPLVAWTVDKTAELYRLATLLDCHPLRAKKARDFVIWRRALIAQRGIDPRRQEVIEAAKRELEEGKRYAASL